MTLVSHVFRINPHYHCVVNKKINSKQRTIYFYVDGNNIRHEQLKVVNTIIDIIKEHFGNLMVYGGKEHTLLGMNAMMREDKKI